MKDMKHSSAKTAISLLASLLLSIFLSVMAIMLSVDLGFATGNSLQIALDDVNYYERVYVDFIDKSEAILIPDGLGKEVLDGVFSVAQFKSDGNAYLDAQLNSTPYQVNLDNYKENLKANIRDYVEKNELTANGDTDAIIDDIVNVIMDNYVKTISIPYATNIGSIFRTIRMYFIYVFGAMIIFALVAIWVINKQNPYKKNRVFRYLAYATMSGAITTLVPPIYCVVTKFYTKIQLYPQYLYDFIVRYIENGIRIMTVIGVILAVSALLMIAASTYLKYSYIHSKKHHHHHHKKKPYRAEDEVEDDED